METGFNQAVEQRYVDLLSNGGFKAFFGDPNNKKEVMMILNTFLPESRKVADIDYAQSELQGPVIGHSKEFRYDFICRDASGTVFIVEMQRYREKSWFKRCVSYASRAYDRQNKSGHDYNVQPVYLIGLMGVPIDHPDKEFWKDRYVSEYTFREKECHDLLDETIVIIFAELASFRKSEQECRTRLDRMLYILKNSGRMHIPPQWAEYEECTEVLDACEIGSFDKDKRQKYDSDMYDEKRHNGELVAAREDGYAEGHAEGRAEGHAEGVVEGEAKGEAKAQTEIARRLLRIGTDIETIADATGLDVDVIRNL